MKDGEFILSRQIIILQEVEQENAGKSYNKCHVECCLRCTVVSIDPLAGLC